MNLRCNQGRQAGPPVGEGRGGGGAPGLRPRPPSPLRDVFEVGVRCRQGEAARSEGHGTRAPCRGPPGAHRPSAESSRRKQARRRRQAEQPRLGQEEDRRGASLAVTPVRPCFRRRKRLPPSWPEPRVTRPEKGAGRDFGDTFGSGVPRSPLTCGVRRQARSPGAPAARQLRPPRPDSHPRRSSPWSSRHRPSLPAGWPRLPRRICTGRPLERRGRGWLSQDHKSPPDTLPRPEASPIPLKSGAGGRSISGPHVGDSPCRWGPAGHPVPSPWASPAAHEVPMSSGPRLGPWAAGVAGMQAIAGRARAAPFLLCLAARTGPAVPGLPWGWG